MEIFRAILDQLAGVVYIPYSLILMFPPALDAAGQKVKIVLVIFVSVKSSLRIVDLWTLQVEGDISVCFLFN